MENRQTILIALIAAAIGIVLGAIGGYAYHRPPSSSDIPTIAQAVHRTQEAAGLSVNTAADNFRVDLHASMVTTAGISADAAFSLLSPQADASAWQAEWSGATQTMATKMMAAYGSGARGQAIAFWLAQAKALSDYAVSAKTGNADGKKKALSDLSDANTAIIKSLKTLNTYLPTQTTQAPLGRLTATLVAATDAYAKGDFAEALSKRATAQDQAGQLADIISAAVIKNVPEKF